jgi:hypothetical protein
LSHILLIYFFVGIDFNSSDYSGLSYILYEYVSNKKIDQTSLEVIEKIDQLKYIFNVINTIVFIFYEKSALFVKKTSEYNRKNNGPVGIIELYDNWNAH